MRRRLASLGVGLLVACGGGQRVERPPGIPACALALQGFWLAEPQIGLHVAERRTKLYRGERLFTVGWIVDCAAGRLTLFVPIEGYRQWAYSLDARGLRFEEPGLDFRRVDPPPVFVAPRPMTFGAPTPLSDDRLREIENEVVRRGVLDQAVRTTPDRAADAASVDADNTSYLTGLVAEVGWIDVRRFGREPARAAFLIVQHSASLPLMMAAVAAMERDVAIDPWLGQYWALLYDRVHLTLGERQRYGSQIGEDEQGRPVVLPLEEPGRVDERRRQVGLPPLAEYTAQFETDGRALEILGWPSYAE